MDAFGLKLILSMVVGSLWIALTTVFAEKYGSKFGGWVSGLPLTYMITLFFIGWTQGTQTVSAVTAINPAMIGFIAVMVLTYILFLPRGFWTAISAGLLAWGLLSYSVIATSFDSLPYSLAIYLVLAGSTYWVVEKKWRIPSAHGKQMAYTIPILAERALLGGAIIGMAVLMTRIGGPIIGGVFSTFPVTVLGTALITFRAQGPEFSAAVLKAYIPSGTSIVVYGVTAHYAFLALGIVGGTLISLLTSGACAYLSYRFIHHKMQ
ncbi:MAG: DUF3147 family protein [Candidatus Diapherotrites archaeon]|nr:DUF3147 family protein [Candidatus Diapherotrites archaeon]